MGSRESPLACPSVQKQLRSYVRRVGRCAWPAGDDFEFAPALSRAFGEKLLAFLKQEFPKDQMMYELHLLRACMAIRKGVSSLEEALKPDPAART